MTTKIHVQTELKRLSALVRSLESDLHSLNVATRSEGKEMRKLANRIEHAHGMAADLFIRLEVALSHVECP